MPDFSTLLRQPAGQAPKPKALVPGDYPAVVKKFEVLPAPEGKDYSAIIRLHLGLMDWPATASEDDKLQPKADGSTMPIDLSKRQLRKDFYDSAMWRFDDFIKSCGIAIGSQTYEEILPQLVGAQATAQVQQYLNQKNNDLGNQVGDLKGHSV